MKVQSTTSDTKLKSFPLGKRKKGHWQLQEKALETRLVTVRRKSIFSAKDRHSLLFKLGSSSEHTNGDFTSVRSEQLVDLLLGPHTPICAVGDGSPLQKNKGK